MKNKNWDIKKIVRKWRPVIETLKFKEFDIKKVCEYAELHSLEESIESLTVPMTTIEFLPGMNKNLLPLSLMILKKVNDLSKIHFVSSPAFLINRNGKHEPESVKTYAFETNISYDQIMSLVQIIGGINTESKIESDLITEISGKINELINDENEIYVYLVAQSISSISAAGKPPKIMLRSRYHVEPCKIQQSSGITINDL